MTNAERGAAVYWRVQGECLLHQEVSKTMAEWILDISERLTGSVVLVWWLS